MTESTWQRRFHPADDPRTPRLVVFPHAGGAASYYFPLSAALAPSVEVVAAQYPGRQERRHDAPAEDLVWLAHELAEDLAGTEAPLFLLGHSMGAVLAFETARWLRSFGAAQPARLFVSGRRAPTSARDQHRDIFADDTALLRELRTLDGTSNALLDNPEIRDMILPAIRADYRMIARYTFSPGEPLDLPVTALIGVEDPRVTLDEALQWRDHTVRGVDVRTFPGGHFYLVDNWSAIAELVSSAIATVPAR